MHINKNSYTYTLKPATWKMLQVAFLLLHKILNFLLFTLVKQFKETVIIIKYFCIPLNM